MKKFILAILCICMIFSGSYVSASTSYKSYTYVYTDEGVIDVASPQAYLPENIYEGSDLGISLKSPEDLAIDSENNCYICDAGTNSIYIISPNMKLLRTITSFKNMGKSDTFKGPKGIYVQTDGTLYIADSQNKRIVVLDKHDQLVRIIGTPKSEVLPADFQFIPQKVLVDNSQRVFVLSKNVYEGILQFSNDGNFIGFVGSNQVVISPLTLIWKKIMSEEQKSKLESFVPVEYTNFSLDYKGFIYAVTSVKNVTNPIRRLNPSGNDILVRNPIDGSKKVTGDVLYNSYGTTGIEGPSSFVDITSDEKGNYYALDDKRGRIFGYDEDGNMLFVFGSRNSGQKGSFESPSAIQFHNGKIFILDRALCQLIIFKPTEYSNLIQKAMNAYIQQDFSQSVILWEKLIQLNGNFDLAYYKAGYGLYHLQKYEKAMQYFKLVNAKTAYSMAFEKNSRISANRNFNKIAGVIVVFLLCIIIIIFMKHRIRRRKQKEINRE